MKEIQILIDADAKIEIKYKKMKRLHEFAMTR